MLPNYSISKLQKVQDKVADVLLDFPGNTIDISNILEISECIYKAIAPKLDHTDFKDKAILVKGVLLGYLNAPLDIDTVDNISKHVAGWYSQILSGRPFKKWNSSMKPVWSCMYIHEVERALTRENRYNVIFESFSGSTTTMLWYKTLPASFLGFLVHTTGGLRREHYTPYDAAGLWITTAIRSINNRVKFEHIHVSNSQKSINREKLKSRKGECKGGFKKGICQNCPLGVDLCDLARHQETYKVDICKSEYPKKHKGPIVKAGYCMTCLRKSYFLKRKEGKSNED